MDKNSFVKASQDFTQSFLDNKADDYMPPDGEYLCIGAGFRTFSEWENAQGNSEMVILPYVQILAHPELTDRKFRLGFFPVSNAGRIGVLFAPETGADPTDMAELYDALTATFGGPITDDGTTPQGKVLTVTIKTTYSKKQKREYQNASITDYPDVAAGEAQESEPEAGGQAPLPDPQATEEPPA